MGMAVHQICYQRSKVYAECAEQFYPVHSFFPSALLSDINVEEFFATFRHPAFSIIAFNAVSFHPIMPFNCAEGGQDSEKSFIVRLRSLLHRPVLISEGESRYYQQFFSMNMRSISRAWRAEGFTSTAFFTILNEGIDVTPIDWAIMPALSTSTLQNMTFDSL